MIRCSCFPFLLLLLGQVSTIERAKVEEEVETKVVACLSSCHQKVWKAMQPMTKMGFRDPLWTLTIRATPGSQGELEASNLFKNQSTHSYVPKSLTHGGVRFSQVCGSWVKLKIDPPKRLTHFFKKDTKCLESFQEVKVKKDKS